MLLFVFFAFLCLPPGFYSQKYLDIPELDPMLKEACITFAGEALTGSKPGPPKREAACYAHIWERLHGTKPGLGDFDFWEFVRKMKSGPEREPCATWFLPNVDGLSKCLRCQRIFCNLTNPLEELAPVIMCAYKTIRAAKPPQEAMKAFEEILYGLMKLSNVPQAKQYLEGGLQHVNISSESASLKYMDEGVAVRVPTYLAEKCSLEAVHHCGNKTMSYSAHLVSSVLCLVKRLTEISTRVMRSSAEELVCGFVQLFRAESESSKPPELRKHLDTLGSVFGCFKRPSKWTTWMKTTQCEGYSY